MRKMPILSHQIPKTIAQAEMRAINRSAVLEYLRLARTAARTEIAHRLQLSKPSVMRIVDELIATGLVCPVGKDEGAVGRSRELLALDTAHNWVAGIDVGGSHLSGVIATIGGQIIHKTEQAVQWQTPTQNFETISEFIRVLLDQAPEAEKLLGLAVGIPGILESSSGIVKLAPSLSWVDFPLKPRLMEKFDLPIWIENDVNLAVLGEYWFGAGVGYNNLIMVAIGTGIGAGIILDGKLHRGFRESSGEIGYMLPGIEYLNNQYPGFGALETVASGLAIAELGKKLAPSPKKQAITSADVFQAARTGEDWAQQVIAETVDYLSLAIANLAVCFDPEIIIVGGGVAGSADLLIDPIKQRIAGVIPKAPQIEATTLGANAPILGAVVRVFQKVTGYTAVHFG
jgi:glucokinase